MVKIYEIIHVKLISTVAKRNGIFMYKMYVLCTSEKSVILLHFDYTNMDVQG